MAVRLNTRNADNVRRQIQGTQLVKLLQNHALNGTEIAPTRLEAAKFLLTHILPKPAQQVEQTGTVTLKWQ